VHLYEVGGNSTHNSRGNHRLESEGHTGKVRAEKSTKEIA
jgi:hypothetical protein